MTKNKENKQRKRYASWSNYRLVSRIILLEGVLLELEECERKLTKVHSKLMKM